MVKSVLHVTQETISEATRTGYARHLRISSNSRANSSLGQAYYISLLAATLELLADLGGVYFLLMDGVFVHVSRKSFLSYILAPLEFYVRILAEETIERKSEGGFQGSFNNLILFFAKKVDR